MMLTQEQKYKLEPLTKHEKYGKLLIDAMKTWETSSPEHFGFGLDEGGAKWKLNNTDCCCLVGAALIGKNKNNELIIESVAESFKLSHLEVWSLSDGFDGYMSSNVEAFQFGNKVSDILFK